MENEIKTEVAQNNNFFLKTILYTIGLILFWVVFAPILLKILSNFGFLAIFFGFLLVIPIWIVATTFTLKLVFSRLFLLRKEIKSKLHKFILYLLLLFAGISPIIPILSATIDTKKDIQAKQNYEDMMIKNNQDNYNYDKAQRDLYKNNQKNK